ncbi:MAG: hypothetical protein LBG50_02990 [Clostridiales Family XIII bacterium]|nr:hypothetical protein [Clostridiales Family XIII bacterium]
MLIWFKASRSSDSTANRLNPIAAVLAAAAETWVSRLAAAVSCVQVAQEPFSPRWSC